MSKKITFIGPIVHSFIKEAITVIEDGVITVVDGKIISIHTNLQQNESYDNSTIVKLEKGQFICPGFIDLHTHAPQFPNIGLGMDKPLLEWIHTYTIPLEKQYSDINFAEKIYSYVINTSLKCGTTTACYYGTIHRESTEKLAQIASKLGQRALIGKVNMNQNSAVDYVETTEESLKETEEFVQNINKLNDPLIEAAITPRFAIACDSNLLGGLGKLASKYNTYIQTHVSENKDEVSLALKLFPECSSYSEIYDRAKLLTPKTILGHGVYLTEEEHLLLSKTGTAIAHCPNSNTLLQSGQCAVRVLWENGINVGLGTDVGAGCNPSILDAMRSALNNSIHISFHKMLIPLTFHEVFYLATLGGAKALRKDDIIGNFIEGKQFDALIIDMNIEKSICCNLPQHSLIEFAVKVGAMSGVCYFTSQYGIWRDSRRTEEIYKEMYTFLAPYVKEVPIEIPELPKASELTSSARDYWNHGVVASAQFIANLPGNVYNLAEKGITHVKNVVNESSGEQKQ